MRDGTRLATDIYLPAGRGPFPTIVVRLPYDKAERENMIEFVADCVNERGYALVAQDSRGKARSEGDLEPFRHERSDGFDTLDWLTQARWCDGRLAMWGLSYFGFTEWAAMASHHPALRAIVPVTTTSFIGSDWLWRQGIFELGFMLVWSAVTWLDRRVYDLNLPLDWNVRPLADVLPAAFGGRTSGALKRMAQLGEHDPVWSAIYGGRPPSLTTPVPALHIGGWWDYFNRGQMIDWALASHTSQVPQPLVMDALDHYLGQWSLDPAGLPEVNALSDADLSAVASDLMSAPLDFFDLVVRDRPGRGRASVTWKLTHADWRTDHTWPPSRSRTMTMHLSAEGDPRSAQGARLNRKPSSLPRWVSWIHDPMHLVPTCGTAHGLTELLEAPDDSAVEFRPDVLLFSTDPFDAELDLAGPIFAHFQVGSSAPSMHVIVRLIDVFPNGQTRRIRDGAALAMHAQGDPHVVVDLGHTGYRVQRGHRLRVHVGSSDFPRYMPYFGDNRDPWNAVDGPKSRQRLRLGGLHGAKLMICVI
ncbi:MAG: CocE/NonD family hydrolase [Candidatus Dormibacteraceae bacterium]